MGNVVIPERVGPLWDAVVTFNIIEHSTRGHGGLQRHAVVGIHSSRGLALSNGVDTLQLVISGFRAPNVP